MSVVLTGAGGMIGASVAQTLLADGQAVAGVDLVTPDKGPELKRWRLHQLDDQVGFALHRLDIRSLEALEPLFRAEPPSAVFNLAAMAGVRESVQNPWLYVDTNVTGTLNLLELCRRYDVPKFVLASTSSIYGDETPRPFLEDARVTKPPSPYAASKLAAEAMAATYARLYGIDVAVPRYFTVYGPAGRPDMAVFRFIRWIAEGEPITVYGDGTQERDFTFVDDIARGTIACLKVEGFEVVNLGNDNPVPLNELIRTIERHVGREARVEYKPGHPADMKATWANIDKARRLLDWQPEVPLDEGVRRSVEWYRENRDLALKVDVGAV